MGELGLSGLGVEDFAVRHGVGVTARLSVTVQATASDGV
jgi:hypothetical protein